MIVNSQISARDSSSKNYVPKIASASTYDVVSNNVTLTGREGMLVTTKVEFYCGSIPHRTTSRETLVG